MPYTPLRFTCPWGDVCQKVRGVSQRQAANEDPHGVGLASIERVWDAILTRLVQRLGAEDVQRLLRPLRPVALTSRELRLEAPTRLSLVCVTDDYLPALREAIAETVGQRQVVLQLSSRQQGELFPDLTPQGTRPTGEGIGLSPKHTFGTFVVGASNQFAHAAAKAVASQPGEHYNPLFIYGGVGLGKTHLVHAIGQQVLERHPGLRVVYLSADTFMSDLIAALRRDRMADFKERFRQVDVLLVDDIQLLAGRERTQEEFFHTFNALHGQRRQIILTSDKVPKDIPDLEERLRNRFEWGLIADIQAPDVETRIAIVQRKAELETIRITPDVALFLAEHFASNVRELEGSLTRLGALASLGRREITVDFAREALQSMLRTRPMGLTADQITDTVCQHFSLSMGEIRSRRRSRQLVVPRQIAMFLCRRLLGASFPDIGLAFDRDHSTVMHANEVIGQRLKKDPSLQASVDRIERLLRGQ